MKSADTTPVRRTREPRRALAATTLGRRAASGDRGASLLIVLAFIILIGVTVAALVGYADTTLRASRGFGDARRARYAADSAMGAAINWAADNPKTALDPTVGVAGEEPCYYVVPASGGQPAVTVTCEADPGDGSGEPNELGQVPKQGILTLGSRNNEPPPFNGSRSCLGFSTTFAQFASIRREMGIRLIKKSDDQTGCFSPSQNPYQNLTINGSVFSNNRINLEGGSNITATGAGNTVTARGTCSFSPCTVLGYTGLDPMGSSNLGGGNDPRSSFYQTTDPTYYNSWRRGAIPAGAPRSIPTACPAPAASGLPPFVVFAPGYYNFANSLNRLFSHPSCKNAVFWFQPDKGPDNTILTDDDRQGIYYFEFQDSLDASGSTYSSCGEEGNNILNARRWCIGTNDDYDQRVIGGTPYGWDPSLLYNGVGGGGSTAPQPTLTRANELFFFQFWKNADRAKELDNNYAEYCIQEIFGACVSAIDRELVMSDFVPKVPEGTFNGATLDIAYYETSGGSLFGGLNAPTLEIRSHSTATGTIPCRTVTLPKRTSPGTTSVDVSDCLNTGAKVNTLEVSFKQTGCNIGCTAKVRLDGVRIRMNQTGGLPQFPAGTPGTNPDGSFNPGGDCDPDKAGVQFIAGGETHIWVSDGSMELCAGSGADADQQIALWGQESVPPLKPNSIYPISVRNPTDVTNGFTKVSRIAESEISNLSQRRIPITYGMSAQQLAECRRGALDPGFQLFQWIHCSQPVQGTIGLTFPGWNPPAQYQADLNANRLKVTKVQLRASYDTVNPQTGFLQFLEFLDIASTTQKPTIRLLDHQFNPITGCAAQNLEFERSIDLIGADPAGGGALLEWVSNIGERYGYSDDTQDMTDITACMPRAQLQQGFAMELNFRSTMWCNAGCSFSLGGVNPNNSGVTDYLDGIEVLVDLGQTTRNTSSPVAAPSSGCARGIPNYYIGDPGRDCALVEASSNAPLDIPLFGPLSTQSQGRMSVKGTIYAPSHAIDVDDFGIRYPLFSRGLVARTLMFRRVGLSADVPAASNTIDKTPAPREATFKACVREAEYAPTLSNNAWKTQNDWQCGTRDGDQVLSVSRVRFELDSPVNPSPTNLPKARIPKIVWWTSERG